MFVPIKLILEHARKNNFAVSRFLTVNLESIEAITRAGIETDAPVVYDLYFPLMVDSHIEYVEYIVKDIGEKSDIPVALFADHVDSVKDCIAAVDRGYTGVMIDLSRYSMIENIKGTKEVVEYARKRGVFVEGEIGTITTASGEGKVQETDPDEAKEYLRKTGVDSLAISIGVKSGFYDGEPEINFGLIKELSTLDVFLVLHGASGLSREITQKCIDCGMHFTGYGTDLMYRFFKRIDEIRKEKGERFIDFSKTIISARNEMQKEIEEKISFLKCGNRGREILNIFKSDK